MDRELDPHLVAADGEGKVFPLREGVNLLGRARRNDVWLNEGSVSRFHCRIERRGEAARIFDTRSSNRTTVNAVQADGQLLNDGDVVCLGRCRLVYHGSRVTRSAPSVSRSRRSPRSGPASPAEGAGRSRAPRRPSAPPSGLLSSPSVALAIVAGAVVLLVGGWLVSRTLLRRDEAPAPPLSSRAEDESSSDVAEVFEVPRSQDDLVGEDARLLAQSQHIDELREQKAELEERLADLERVRGRDELLEKVLLELEVLQGKLSRSEKERTELEDRLRAQIRRVSERGARPSNERGRSRTEVDRSTRTSPRNPVDVEKLVARLRGVVENYASPDTTPDDLEPSLGELSSSQGEKAAAGVLAVYRYGAELLAHVERSIALNRRRYESLRAEAKRLAPQGHMASSEDGYYPRKRPGAELELKQREMELSAKAVSILDGQRGRLDHLLAAVARSAAHLRGPEAARHLLEQFPQEKDSRLRRGMATAFARARLREAVPLLIRVLGTGDPELRGAAHGALVEIVGEDLGRQRDPWQEWWGENRAGIEGRGLTAR